MTIPASQRYKKYDPVVLTDVFDVPFPLFANDDLRVVVDGVETPLFSVLAVYYRGRCETAQIVLTAAVTGVSVEIYGKRVPRRSNDFAANSPDLARNLQNDSDILTAVQQEQERDRARALKVPAGFTGSLEIPAPIPGAALVGAPDGLSYVNGPEVTSLAGAAAAAAASAVAAAASAADALAKQNSMVRDRGPWVTTTSYAPSDTFDNLGNVYITQTAHISTSIAADLSAGRIRLWVQKGAAGAGTGDMLYADNLASLTNKPLAFANIGGKAVGKVDLLTFSLIAPAALISDVQGLALNKVPNAIPVAKAVTDYVDAIVLPAGPIAQFTVSAPVASIQLMGLAGWDEVEISGELTSTTALTVRTSPDNGLNFRAVNYDHRVIDGVGGDVYDIGFRIARIVGTGPQSFNVRIKEMANATRRTKAVGNANYANNTRNNVLSGALDTLEICNALQVSGGSITAGFVEVRGIRRAFVADTVAPTLISASPADNAINIPLAVSPVLIFSETVLPGTGFITLRQNISSVWSNVEQFDVVTEQGVGVGQVSFAGSAVTLNPTADLVAGREYALQIAPTAIKDASNNFYAGIATDTALSFTAATSIVPTLISSTPADDATNVAITVSPILTFSEAVFPGTGNIVLRQNIAGTWVELQTFDVVAQAGTGNGQVNFSGSNVTINPTADLVAGREYAIRVPATAVKNSVNNFFAGITNDTTVSFSTVAAVAATFVTLALIDNEVTYQLSGPGTVHWSVDDVASPSGATIDTGTGAYAFGNFNAAPGSNVVSLNFTGVPPGSRNLHLVVTGVGLTNYGTPQHFTINVVAADVVAPTIISSVPSDNATGVAAGVSPTITFSETVVFGTGNVTLRQNIASVWSDVEAFDVVTEVGVGNGQISVSGATITINPTTNLTASREYAIRIDATAIKDAANNAFAGIANDTTLSFTVAAAADVTPPTLSSSVPADNATGISATVSPALTFSEAIAFGTGLITLRQNIASVWSDVETFNVASAQGSADGQVSISGSVLTINPTGSLVASREYALRIASTAITDLASNAFAGIANDTSVSFTIAAAGYTRNVVDNNGTARLTSAADTAHRQSITFAGWFRTDTVGGQAVLVSWSSRSELRRFTDKLNVYIEDSAATTRWDVQIPSVFAVGTWVHIYVQVDLAAVTAVVKINGTTISGGGMTINTALSGGTGLIYLNTGQVELLHSGATAIFDGSVSDLVDYHTTGAAKPSNDFYVSGTGTDPTAIGTPFVVLGGTMTADARAGNTAQGWNDSYTPGSATITTNSATFTDSTI